MRMLSPRFGHHLGHHLVPVRVGSRSIPLLSFLAAALTAVLVAALLAVPPSAHAAPAAPAAASAYATRAGRPAGPTGGLVLWYRLDQSTGGLATDTSGRGRHGVLNGGVTWTRGQGLSFDGSTGFVKLPDNVMSGLDSITVTTDVFIDRDQKTPYFLYGLGNSSGDAGNGYLFATGDSYRASISPSNWSGEQTTRPSGSPALARGTWKHIAYTQTGTTGVLYEDGVEVARNTSVSVTPAAVGGGATTANYLGRSLYSADARFKGRLRDFRVYDRALAAQEVASLATPVNTEALCTDTGALSLGDLGGVTGDLTLPAEGTGGSKIAWSSSDPAVISKTGVVTRPAVGRPNVRVTLTATLTRGAATATKTFRATVLSRFTDREAVRYAAGALAVRGVSDVRENLDLPPAGPEGTTVRWSSAKPSVLSPTGEVKRPAHGAGNTTVTLTATLTKGAATATRSFTATVQELPAAQSYAGYLFSYFTGEGTADGEQVYFSLSQGDDPLHWQQLNNSKPVLRSTLGTTGLRDPFIIRSPAGDKFYQIATDLRIYGNGNWDAAQRTGSKSIMVWESTDLVNWTNQRLVKVSPDTAGNTWAPEAFYDPTIGSYVVFWASKIYAADDPGHTGSTYNKMMYATTRDFHTFSAPKVWKDPGYSVIDSTMIEHGGTYYRYTKDERDPTSSTPCSKFIIAEKSTTVRDLDYDFLSECIGRGTISRGEGPLVFKSNTGNKWHMFIDEFGGRGYVPFETTDLTSGRWTASTGYSLPSSPRHGTVLPVTQAEYDRLLRAYQPDQLVTGVGPVRVTTRPGAAPRLPETVSARHADGGTRGVPVTWEKIDPVRYAAAGSFTVAGSLGPGVSVPARATVTVTSGAIPVEKITVSPSTLRIGVGSSRALKAIVSPADATDTRLTWTSSDPSVAKVSDTGVVTTIRPGRTRITARPTAGGTARTTARTTAGGMARAVAGGTAGGAVGGMARTVAGGVADRRVTASLLVEVTRDIPPDLLAWYPFDERGGTVARDASGRGNDGTYSGNASWGYGVRGGSFVMSGGPASSATAPYVTIPGGVLSGLDSVTVSAWVQWTGSTTVNQWLYGLGPDDTKYLFTTPSGGGKVLYSAITTGSWQAESKLAGDAALPDGRWQHVAVTVDGTARTAVMYLGGTEVARATGVAVKPSDLYDASSGRTGHIGKSLYGADPYFAGSVDDFRIHGRALTTPEIMALAGNTTGIASVTLGELKAPAVITGTSGKVVLPVKEGTRLTALAPKFTLADGARISPASGTVRDLTKPVTYQVTGADGARRTWTVEAHVMRSPVLPGLYADPNITVFGGTFYMYATTDGFDGWSGTKFHAFSSTDLLHWKDHGVILDLGPDISWADERAWAPAIAERNGKYYFYFSADTNIGVAVADSPAGPFRDPLGKPLIAAGAFGGQMIDPAVFTDDDGKSYLYFGNGRGYVVELNDDMVSFDAAQVKDITPSGYNEGSFVVKRGGTYYFMWSENDTRDPNYQVAYATGPSPYGPWTKRGVILSKRPEHGILATGHHSVVRVPGTDDWFTAYHRFAIPGGDGTHRETTIDRLTFNADGTIAPVVPTLESVDPVTTRSAPSRAGS